MFFFLVKVIIKRIDKDQTMRRNNSAKRRVRMTAITAFSELDGKLWINQLKFVHFISKGWLWIVLLCSFMSDDEWWKIWSLDHSIQLIIKKSFAWEWTSNRSRHPMQSLQFNLFYFPRPSARCINFSIHGKHTAKFFPNTIKSNPTFGSCPQK